MKSAFQKFLYAAAQTGLFCTVESAKYAASKKLFKKAKQNAHCRNGYYPDTNIQRQPVPDSQVAWHKTYSDYQPTPLTLFISDQLCEADPDITDPDFQPKFNSLDGNIDRRSCTGRYDVIDGIPVNPVGRTGITGKGSLPRWGPNHRIYLIFTRLNVVEVSKNLMQGDGLEFTEILAAYDERTQSWSVPNGFFDQVELDASNDLLQRLKDEVTVHGSPEMADKMLTTAVKHQTLVARSYYDDPRNTDNAWVEVVVYEFICSHGLDKFDFSPSHTNLRLQWRNFDQSPLEYQSFLTSSAC